MGGRRERELGYNHAREEILFSTSPADEYFVFSRGYVSTSCKSDGPCMCICMCMCAFCVCARVCIYIHICMREFYTCTHTYKTCKRNAFAFDQNDGARNSRTRGGETGKRGGTDVYCVKCC